MKKISIIFAGFLLFTVTMMACRDEFLDQSPLGTFNEDVLKNRAGVEGMLISAYALLDGTGASTNDWQAAGSGWVFGSVTSDEAYKGSDAGDQSDINQIERHEPLPTNGYFNHKWRTVYDGVARANSVLRILPEVEDIEDNIKDRIVGEARFLRGHYHFEAKRMWNMVPYVDEEAIDYSDFNSAKIPNDQDIWPQIEADLKFAMENLPGTQNEVGRANKWAAAAYLAKVYIYQKKFAEARPILEDVIQNGTNSAGVKYKLTTRYEDNFNPEFNNNSETVFAYQASINDGAGDGRNANRGEMLNYPHGAGGPGGCCGFFQPSQNLVNSFKTADGLPMPEDFDQEDVKHDQGIDAEDDFTPYEGAVDPRLDWTVGRRGIPYYDWGNHPGVKWIRDQAYAGPYSPKKNVYRKSHEGDFTDGSSWTNGLTAQNVNLIRFADVLLWAAEAEVEAGSMEQAREYVNRIRERAANPEGFVLREILDEDGAGTGEFEPAANYVINTYETAWSDKTAARRAVQFERKLELGMEGHRFFDLVRYGTAAETMNAYFAKESKSRQYLGGAKFTSGVNEYFPIPEAQIAFGTLKGEETLKQNPGY